MRHPHRGRHQQRHVRGHMPRRRQLWFRSAAEHRLDRARCGATLVRGRLAGRRARRRDRAGGLRAPRRRAESRVALRSVRLHRARVRVAGRPDRDVRLDVRREPRRDGDLVPRAARLGRGVRRAPARWRPRRSARSRSLPSPSAPARSRRPWCRETVLCRMRGRAPSFARGASWMVNVGAARCAWSVCRASGRAFATASSRRWRGTTRSARPATATLLACSPRGSPSGTCTTPAGAHRARAPRPRRARARRSCRRSRTRRAPTCLLRP